MVNHEVDLTGATVVPASAPQTITWRIKDPGISGLTHITDGKFTPLKAENGLKLTAVVAGGGSGGGNYTEDFTIRIVREDQFVAVSGIYNVLSRGTAGAAHTLTGVVRPYYATNTAIGWTLTGTGGTGATLDGTTLTTAASGIVTLRATVTGGGPAGGDFTQDLAITIAEGGILEAVPGPGLYTFTGAYSPEGPLAGLTVAADFEDPDDPADFLYDALSAVEAGKHYLIVLGRDYALKPQYLDQPGALVVLTGWETQRNIISEEANSTLIQFAEGSLVLGSNITVFNTSPTATGRLIKISGGGSLELYAGACLGRAGQVSGGGAVEVTATGTFTMHGGTITNCNASLGGGVYNNGTFIMEEGSITGNTAAANGGGDLYNNGTFTQNGGTVGDIKESGV
jgi:hypothetical protein